MTAMDPIIPSGPSSAWIALGVIWAVAVGILAFVLWSLCRPEPAGTPLVEQAPADGVDEHAETAAAHTRPLPDVTTWLPTDTDPRDDAEGVLVEPPPFLTGQRSADLPPDLELRIPPSVVDHFIQRVERYLKEQVK